MKKFAALILTLALALLLCHTAVAEETYFFTTEQVEERFFNLFGYTVDVTQHQGLDDDPEGWYFRIPNSKCMQVSYLAVDAFSMDGTVCYVNAQKINDFFRRHSVKLELQAWESLEEPNYFSLEEVNSFLGDMVDIKTKTLSDDSVYSFKIYVETNNEVNFSVKFGSLWRKEIAEGEFIYHQAVVTELYQQLLNATAGK